MTAKQRNHITDLRSVSRMAIEATIGLTNLVEALHTRIARQPAGLAGPPMAGARRNPRPDGVAALAAQRYAWASPCPAIAVAGR
jgi:hypothetical protein